MQWSPFLGDETREGLIVAYAGEAFDIEALTLIPRIVHAQGDEETKGLQIIVKCGDLELTRETEWGIGVGAVFGDPNEFPNKEFLEEVVSALAPQAVYQAHLNIRVMQRQTEEFLKVLREANEQMSFVTLEYNSSRIRLSLGLAQQVLLFHYRRRGQMRAINPFRLQRESNNVAVVFDEQNRVISRIGFNPEVPEYRSTQGRLGCYVIPEEGEESNAASC